ncbi:hypothetical protein ACFCYM_07195 [Streptomyces sp. NPDC056254]|uniref:hypothetical protein n=1 Tax=Streptomyces sp. NPDC056254 TaxID=3345763 RepID=UPI0035DC0B17
MSNQSDWWWWKAISGAPFTRRPMRVAYRADGSERFRLYPPRGLLREQNDVRGFYTAFPRTAGRS